MTTAAGSGGLYRLHLGGAVLDRVAPDESSGLSSTEIASIVFFGGLLAEGSKAAETTEAAFKKWKRRIVLPDSLTVKDARKEATEDESGTAAAAIDPLSADLSHCVMVGIRIYRSVSYRETTVPPVAFIF